jgi:O-antigen/teichoic acid export membrane protein
MNQINLKKNINTHLFFNYYSVIFNITINILLLPLYLNYIDKSLYGYWLATGSLLGILSIVDPGMADFIKQKTGQYYGEKKFDLLIPFLKTSFFITMVFSLLFFVVGFFMKDLLFNFINIHNHNFLNILDSCFILTLGSTSLMLLNYSLNAFSIGIMSSLGQGVIFVISSLVMVILTIFFLLTDHGLFSLVYGILARSIIVFLLTLIYIYRRYLIEKWSVSIKYIKLYEVLPTILHSYSGRVGLMLLSNMENILITRYLGPTINLNYSVTRKVFDTLRLFFEKTLMSFLPSITFMNATNNLNLFFVKYQNKLILIFFLFFFAGVWCILFNEFFVALWVGISFYSGDLLNLLIFSSVLINLISYCLSNFLYSIGDVLLVNKINLIQAMVTFVCSFIGIKFLGLEGYIFFQLSSILFLSVVVFTRRFLSKQDMEFKFKPNNKLIFFIVLAAILFYFITNMINVNSYLCLIIYSFFYATFFAGILIVFSVRFRTALFSFLKLSFK